MSRILVTGGSGFIGRHVLPLLVEKGWEVHATTRNTVINTCRGVQWHDIDLFEQPQTAFLFHEVRPTHLLHLAWYAEPGLFWRSLVNYRWVEASLGLLRAFHDAGGKRAVFAGTCAEYDGAHGYCTETLTPLRPATPYGTAKHALQLLLSSYAKETGIKGAWGRIFLPYGPDENPARLVPSVVRSLLAAKPAACTSGEQIADFLHVADVASGFVTLVEQNAQGPFNIGSGIPVAVKEVVGMIANQIGRSDLVRLGALPSRNMDTSFLVANASSLKSLGWCPRYTLEEGIAQTIAWWKIQENPPPC